MTREEAVTFRPVAVPDRRRGLWARATSGRATGPTADGEFEISSLEIAAGREGDDAHVTLRAGDTLTPRILHDLHGALTCLRYAHSVAEGNWHQDLASAEAREAARARGAGAIVDALDVAERAATSALTRICELETEAWDRTVEMTFPGACPECVAISQSTSLHLDGCARKAASGAGGVP